ncbi:hypothetical protein [Acinetobacter sp. MDS7A]|uniref:hypothetical protein n=1 Tax=Acinetobacter towneri TaxID=202956 RepID=UPI00037E9DD5
MYLAPILKAVLREIPTVAGILHPFKKPCFKMGSWRKTGKQQCCLKPLAAARIALGVIQADSSAVRNP